MWLIDALHFLMIMPDWRQGGKMPEAYLWEAAIGRNVERTPVQEGIPGDTRPSITYLFTFLRSKLQWKCHKGCQREGKAWGQYRGNRKLCITQTREAVIRKKKCCKTSNCHGGAVRRLCLFSNFLCIFSRHLLF